MKKIYGRTLALLCAVGFFTSACEEIDIPTYKLEDSAVMFKSPTIEISLKGNSEARPRVRVPLSFYGPICQYDRPVKVAVVDTSLNTALSDPDFKIDTAVVSAGASEGLIMMTVGALPEELESRTVVLKIEENEHFSYQRLNLNIAAITWSKSYVRPDQPLVFQSWFNFFCPGYSKALHELLYQEFGPDIEISSHMAGIRKIPGYKYKAISWWYTASRQFYESVRAHDLANPDNPYMHSSDYEQYAAYNIPVGSGTKPETIPTILSTLLVL